MNNLEKKLNKVIKNKSSLSKFIMKKVNSRFFAKKNKKELVKLLPIIIANTNSNDWYWMQEDSFVKTTGFLDIFIEHLSEFKFFDSDQLLMNSYKYIFSKNKLTKEQLKKIIAKSLESSCEIQYETLKKLYIIIERNEPNLIEYMLKEGIVSNNASYSCILFIIKNNRYMNLLYDRFDYILPKYSIKIDLFYLKEVIEQKEIEEKKGGNIIFSDKDKAIIEKLKEKIKTQIESNEKEYIKLYIKNIYMNFIYNMSLKLEEQKKLDTILEITYLIIKDISKNRKAQITDITFLGEGSYSKVLQLGDKVIKIGTERETPTFPNNPYLNAILLRKMFPITDNESFIIEVQELNQNKPYVTMEELNILSENLKKIGLRWNDEADRNITRLLRDNQVYWEISPRHQQLMNEKKMLPYPHSITDESLGLQAFRGEGQLKKGNIVICDADFIYYDESPNFNKPENHKKTLCIYESYKKKK